MCGKQPEEEAAAGALGGGGGGDGSTECKVQKERGPCSSDWSLVLTLLAAMADWPAARQSRRARVAASRSLAGTPDVCMADQLSRRALSITGYRLKCLQ